MKYCILLLLALVLPACSVYSPDAGHEVVLVEKPWFFGHGGVDPDPVKPGRTFAALTTEGVDVYMQPMKAETEMQDTMTSDGVPISFHAIMVLQVTDSVSLIKNFGSQWYKKQSGGAVQDDGPAGGKKARHERDGDQHDGAGRDR